ncbi:MAG: Bug family tripartite tricarboxylate transporter substrate binding protein [Beijerinckiaceae bacterium]
MRKAAAAAVAVAGLTMPSVALAADYFAGKTITVEVPAGSGGSYHVYCQIVQNNLGKYIPGNPSLIVKNVPGAGGVVSAANMANIAPKDGTHIAMMAPGTITIPLMRKMKFDASKFNYLGSLAARSSAIWVWHTKGVKNLDDLKTKQVKLASSAYTSAASVIPRLVNKVFGTKIDIVYGYKGGGAMNIAIERGEVDGRWNYRNGFVAVRPQWIKEGKIVPVIAMGPRDPDMKGVPFMRDLLKEGSPEQKLHDVFDMNFQVGQAFYAPQGVKPEIVAILRAGFAKMIADPATKAMMEKRGVEFSPKSASEVEAAIRKGLAAASPDVVETLKSVFLKSKT